MSGESWELSSRGLEIVSRELKISGGSWGLSSEGLEIFSSVLEMTGGERKMPSGGLGGNREKVCSDGIGWTCCWAETRIKVQRMSDGR
jgi:hypothetical protein